MHLPRKISSPHDCHSMLRHCCLPAKKVSTALTDRISTDPSIIGKASDSGQALQFLTKASSPEYGSSLGFSF